MVASVAAGEKFYALAAWSFALHGWVTILVSSRREVVVALGNRIDRWLPLHVCIVEVEADDDDAVEAALETNRAVSCAVVWSSICVPSRLLPISVSNEVSLALHAGRVE